MRFNLVFIGILLLIFTGCKKKKNTEPEVATNLQSGWLILNEGLFQQNNSTLGWYNLNSQTYSNNFFEQKTNRSLGDTGNDLQKYGGKVYVVVNVSSTLEILDAKTGSSLKQIQMQNNGQAKQPRTIRFYNGKGYITCYDGYVDVLDTTSMTITNRIHVGSNPEGLAFSNGKLFVANSGGLNAPLMDSTVSVIDLNTQMELIKIKVGMNPSTVLTDASGEIYVITRGNYSSIPARLHRIDPTTLTVTQDFNFDINSMTAMNNVFIYSFYNYSNSQQTVGIFDPLSETITNSNFIAVGSITTLYGIQYISSINKIVCCDAKNYTTTGEVFVYNADGTYLYKFSAGLNPSKVLYYE